MGQARAKHNKHEQRENILKSHVYFSLNLICQNTSHMCSNLICFHICFKEMNQAHYHTWLWVKQWLMTIVYMNTHDGMVGSDLFVSKGMLPDFSDYIGALKSVWCTVLACVLMYDGADISNFCLKESKFFKSYSLWQSHLSGWRRHRPWNVISVFNNVYFPVTTMAAYYR